MVLLTRFLPISAALSNYLYRHTPSGQSRVYQVTELCTNDIHCRESAGTGPVILKVLVPVTGAVLQLTIDQLFNIRLSFPTPTIRMKWACMLNVSEYVWYGHTHSKSTVQPGKVANLNVVS